MGGILPRRRRRLRKCRKGEKNCWKFPNALAKEMITNAARKLLDNYSSQKPLLSWGLKLVQNERGQKGGAAKEVNWPRMPRSRRKSRSLTEAPSPCNCRCPQAPAGEVGGVEKAVGATVTDTIPSSNPPTPQKTLPQKVIAKIAPIFKWVEEAGEKTLDVAKDQIKRYQPMLLDLAKKHGKAQLKKYLEKQRAAATGGKQLLYQFGLELLGGTNSDEKASAAKVSGTTDEGLEIINQV